MKYNIRCCCQPTKILGTLELSDWKAEAARSFSGLAIAVATQLFPVTQEMDAEGVFVRTETIKLKQFVKIMRDRRESEWAVYSDDRPLEFWERVPGFEPVPGRE